MLSSSTSRSYLTPPTHTHPTTHSVTHPLSLTDTYTHTQHTLTHKHTQSPPTPLPLRILLSSNGLLNASHSSAMQVSFWSYWWNLSTKCKCNFILCQMKLYFRSWIYCWFWFYLIMIFKFNFKKERRKTMMTTIMI